MSQVKISGNASGTGVLTISAPNTNTDRSITIPDKAGAIAVGAGTIVQVVHASTETEVVVSTETFTDIGLSASITPSSSSNKVLVQINPVARWDRSAANAGGGYRILRDSTIVHSPQQGSGSGPLEERFQFNGATGSLFWTRTSLMILDSPASTSSLTYKVQGANHDNASNGDVTFQQNSTTYNSKSYITLMEVVA